MKRKDRSEGWILVVWTLEVGAGVIFILPKKIKVRRTIVVDQFVNLNPCVMFSFSVAIKV